MSVLACPKCGASNNPPARYCGNCGTPLSAVPGPTPPAMGYVPPPGQQYYPSQYPVNYWEVVRTNRINNTLTGLLLLVIGVLIAWVPFAGFIGGIVGFIGGILVWVGREPFGVDHVRTTTLALIFFVVGIAVTIFGFFYAWAYNVASGLGVSYITLFGINFLIGSSIFGLSEVLLTYSLQRNKGRRLLWTAYGLSIVLGLVNVLLLPFSTNGLLILFFGTGAFLFTGLLAAAPAAFYGTAFYLARERIVRHEIPPPMKQESGKPPW
jgi:zinc ribbon protein